MLNEMIGQHEELQVEIEKLDALLNGLHDAIAIHGEDATGSDLPEDIVLDLEDLGWDIEVPLGKSFKDGKLEEDELFDRYNAVANVLDRVHW